MDVAEEHPGAAGTMQQEGDGEVERLLVCSRPQQEEVQPRQKRHLSRSLDLSRGSVSSRAAKHQKQGEISRAVGHAVAPGSSLFMHGSIRAFVRIQCIICV